MNKRKVQDIEKSCSLYVQLIKENCNIQNDIYCQILQSLYIDCNKYKFKKENK